MTIEIARIALDIVTLLACGAVSLRVTGKLEDIETEIDNYDQHCAIQYSEIIGQLGKMKEQLPKKRNRKTTKQEVSQ